MRLDSTRAMFLMFSGAISVEARKHGLHALGARHARDITAPDALVPRAEFDVGKLRYEELSPEERDFLLLTLHERNHFDRFLGSPLGLLVYRSYLTLTVTLNWLFARFFVPGGLADEARGRPFVDWVRTQALDWIGEAVAAGRIALPGDAIDRPELEWAQRLVYVREVALPELIVLSDFIRALLGRPEGMTMGGFADLANRAFHHLSLRGEMPVTGRWTTQYPELPLHPAMDSALSVSELFELAALAAEHEALEAMQATPQAMASWFAGYQGDPYARGLHLSRQSDIPMGMLGDLASRALRSPCDLVLHAGSELRVEQLHPTWRFRSFYFQMGDMRDCPSTGRTRLQRVEPILDAMRAQGMAGVEQVLCEEGMFGPLPTMWDLAPKAVAGPYVGEGANVFPTPEQQQDFHTGHAVADMFEVFRAGIQADADPDAMRRIHERLVYYEDEAAFPNMRAEQDLHLALVTHLACVSGYLHLSNLFDGLDASDVPAWDRACLARLRRFLPDDPERAESRARLEAAFSTASVAVDLFGAPYARAMGFSPPTRAGQASAS